VSDDSSPLGELSRLASSSPSGSFVDAIWRAPVARSPSAFRSPMPPPVSLERAHDTGRPRRRRILICGARVHGVGGRRSASATCGRTPKAESGPSNFVGWTTSCERVDWCLPRWSPSTITSSPPARQGVLIASLSGRLLLSGGWTDTPSDPTGNVLGDTWTFGASVWAEVTVSCSPTPREYAAMATLGDEVVLFSGADIDFNALGDTGRSTGRGGMSTRPRAHLRRGTARAWRTSLEAQASPTFLYAWKKPTL
jgi:hypothetical protein